MRQYGEVPPWLATANTPVVKSTTGLGAGGGASVFTADSGGFGDINVYAGPGVAASGSVVFTFPNTPPTLFIAAAELFGAVSQSTTGNDVTISWSAATLIPRSNPYNIHYEWSVSQ